MRIPFLLQGPLVNAPSFPFTNGEHLPASLKDGQRALLLGLLQG
jgi:hypothetical protein